MFLKLGPAGGGRAWTLRSGWGGLLAAIVLATPVALADLPVEPLGRVLTLPAPSAHWAWVADFVLRRSSLVDLDSGRMLGMVSTGLFPLTPLNALSRGEAYQPETYYSRGSRGERTDVLTIYDMTSLVAVDEVVLPPRRALSAVPDHHAALTDDERFAVVFNLTPATSISVVDLEERRLAAEIPTPGCSLVYPVSGRRIAALCMDGALLLIGLDDRGAEASRVRSERFFDPESDPITEKGARVGDRWLYASFDGFLHEVNLAGRNPIFPEPWSLLSDAERADDWRIGGTQHLAVHRASGRLFSLMHQGGADTHKDAGSEIWVYDLASQQRVQRIQVESPGVTIMGFPLEAPQDWVWPLGAIVDALIDGVGAAIGVNAIRVTQDAEPLLVTASSFTGGMAIYNALTGDFVRRIYSGNLINMAVSAPFGAGRGE